MCRPDYFDIEYEINPWMHLENQVDQEKAMIQWQTLYDAFVDNGVIVDLIRQVKGLPDMTFTANGGIAYQNKFIVSRHRYKERTHEEAYFEKWFQEQGFETYHIKHFQGGEGDALFYKGTLYMGYGFRSDRESHDEVRKILGVKTVSLCLINPYFYDFDTAFSPLGEKALLYYPDAFSEESRNLLENIPDAIPFSKLEAESFVGNSILVGDTLFVGYKDNILVEMGEFKKSGGGIKCLTLYLDH